MYDGQLAMDLKTANIHYYFKAEDTSHLYRIYNQVQGVDFACWPEINVDAWLNPKSPQYHATLAQAIFYYC